MHKVAVNLGEASYEILIGEALTEAFVEFLQSAAFSRRALVVSDRRVGALYGETVLAALQRAGFTAKLLNIEAGEPSKSLQTADMLYTKAISLGLDRKSLIVAVGGGVVGDLTGFVAATFMRGVPFIQMPTSLLAQVDSSVGGKVAVNHPLGKNLIGAFYQPQGVFIDLAMLKTLPQREIYTGLAEIVKYGVIYDRDFFAYLEAQAEAILRLDTAVMARVIARSCAIKAAVVSKDEKETGLRIILNFGHTIAHAIESETGYTRYNHGEAVAIGMHGAALLSCTLQLISQEMVERIKALLVKFHLPLQARQCDADRLFHILFRDKKAIGGRIQWILAEDIGRVCVRKDVADDLVQRVLKELVA